jgi:carboxymethylenebutenolidase
MNRYVLSLTVALLAAAVAPAQDWAKAKLEKSPRHGEWVMVKHGKRQVKAFVVYPEVKDKATAVVVIHEIFGLSDWAQLLADELAAAGYIAIAPDLLWGTAPKGGGTDELGERKKVVSAIFKLPPDQITADLNACVKYVKKLPACNGKVAACGFCWGGGQVFRFATNNKTIQAAFVFYGPPPDKADMARIACPVYGFYGGNDARIDATIPKTKEEMKDAGKTYEPVIYEGAGHGFMRAGEEPKASPANRRGRDAAWKRWKGLLKKL